MTNHYHAVVWMDHQHARILGFSADASDTKEVRTHLTGHHRQHRANTHGSGHRVVDRDYFMRIIEAIGAAGAVLLCGPGTAKIEFRHFLQAQAPSADLRIAAVQAVDHPTDRMLIDHGRRFFRADDRLHSQTA